MNEKVIIDAPYIYQGDDYPNGCESVSAVMALNYLGVDIDVEAFISRHLICGPTPKVGGTGPDPSRVYCGDPRSKSGWGCYSPVIVNALTSLLDESEYTVTNHHGASLDFLCGNYIDRGLPVILWATVGMTDSSSKGYCRQWTTDDGRNISYNSKLHCLLLVGYDGEYFYFNDPLCKNEDGTKYTAYKRADVERAYEILNCQSIVIEPSDLIGITE